MSSPTLPPTQTPSLLLPFLASALRESAHLAIVLPKYVFNLLTYISRTAFISPLAYLLAPVVAFLSIIFSITLRTPYQFFSWLLEAIFPLYVFCGVACITGGLLGLGGRMLSQRMIRAVSEGHTEGQTSGNYEETMKNNDEDMAERSAKRRRVERDAARVKFEHI